MAKAVRFYEAGGPDVLKYEDATVGDPGPGEVRIRHAAIGCNFADTYFRSGYYPAPLPNGIGVEGAGTIEAVAEVSDSVMPGVICMPHGWGHASRDGVGWRHAAGLPAGSKCSG